MNADLSFRILAAMLADDLQLAQAGLQICDLTMVKNSLQNAVQKLDQLESLSPSVSSVKSVVIES